MFEEAYEIGELQEDIRTATIVLIPKPGKPRNKCESYRPISLINSEAKVLAKILAERMKTVIRTLVHPDQTGFMPHGSTKLNLRRLHTNIDNRGSTAVQRIIRLIH